MLGDVHRVVLKDVGVVQAPDGLERLFEVENVLLLDLAHLDSVFLASFSVDAPLDPAVGSFPQRLAQLKIIVELLDVLGSGRFLHMLSSG